MKPCNKSPYVRHTAALAALAAALILAVPTVAPAAMTKDQVAQKIEKEFKVKVLRVEPMTEDGKPIFAVTVMGSGGDWNHAFQVNTIAVDAATGLPVVQFGQFDGRLRKPAPFVGERTAPLTAEDR
ncbi:MAG: PepSY domain-containing protein [Rhodospirillales bacterium]|nr:PepSY domain-containing protein [Rhodospirillales bacterium]